MVINKTFVLSILILLLAPLILAETSENQANPGTLEQKSISLTPECISGHFNELNKRVFEGALGIIIFLILLDTILKGFALWRAVHRNSKPWFIILLVLFTLGILPLIYLIMTRKKK